MTHDDSDQTPTNDELVRLRQRVAELEQRAAESAQLEQTLRESESRYQRIISNVPGMVYQFVLRVDGSAYFPFASDGCRELYGIEPSDLERDAMIVISKTHPDDLPAFQQSVLDSAASLQPWTWEGRTILASGEQKWLRAVSRPQRLPNGDTSWDGMLMDITQRKQAEEALSRSMAQEEIIQMQAAALAELSTPLIPINDEVMVMPLIGSIDSARAQQVLESLLEGAAKTRAAVVILDITGVPIVDTQVASALLQSARAVRLLGARVVLTGIRPEVAQTLVGLGIDLTGIVTRSTLQSGITYALERRSESA